MILYNNCCMFKFIKGGFTFMKYMFKLVNIQYRLFIVYYPKHLKHLTMSILTYISETIYCYK